MTKQTGILLGILLFLGVVAFSYFSLSVSTKNKEATLRVQINKQTDVCSIVFDDMWKIIKKKAQVPEHYKNDFKDLIVSDNTTSYGDKGLQIGGLMNMIQKTNPKFDDSMYKDLMQTIEAEMKRFEMEQKKLISLSEEHEIMLKTFPSSFFLSDKDSITVKLITSGKTKEAYLTGEDNDTDVFDTPKVEPIKDSIK